MIIKQAIPGDESCLAAMASRLFSAPAEALLPEFRDLLTDPQAACFLAFRQEEAIGFAQCQLRHDYVEGCETSPVGYLEGIFVDESHRHQGIARALLSACEAWVRRVGCTEFASDCELDNAGSLRFHQAMGFTEANRIICFTKFLGGAPHA